MTIHKLFLVYSFLLIGLLIAEISILLSHNMVLRDFVLAAFVTIGIQACFGTAIVILLSRKSHFPNAWLAVLPAGLSANAVIAGFAFSQNAPWLYYILLLSACLVIAWNGKTIKTIGKEITKNKNLLNFLIFITAIFIIVYSYDRGPWLSQSNGRLSLNLYWDQLGYLGELQQMNLGLIPDLQHLRLSGFHDSAIQYNARSYQYTLLFKLFNIDAPTLFFGFHKLWILVVLSLGISFLTYSYRKKTLDVILANTFFFILPAILEPIFYNVVFFYSDFFMYLSRSASAMLGITVILTAISFFLAGIKEKNFGSLIFSSILFGLLLFVRGPFYLVMFPAYCLNSGIVWLFGAERPRFSTQNQMLKNLIFSIVFGISLTVYLFVIKKGNSDLGSNSIGIQFGLYAEYVSTHILTRYDLGIGFLNLIQNTSQNLKHFLVINFFMLSRCLALTLVSFIVCWPWRKKQARNSSLTPLLSLFASVYFFTLIYCLTLVQIDKGAYSAWAVVGSMCSLIYFFDPFFTALVFAAPARALILKLALKAKHQIYSQILDYVLVLIFIIFLYLGGITVVEHFGDISKEDYTLLKTAQKLLPKEAIIGSLSRNYTADDKVAAFSGRSSFIARSPEMTTYFPKEASLRFEVLSLFSENLSLEKKLALAKAYNITHLFVSSDQKEAPTFPTLNHINVGNAVIYDLEATYKGNDLDWGNYIKWLEQESLLDSSKLLTETRFLQLMNFGKDINPNLSKSLENIIEKKWQLIKKLYDKTSMDTTTTHDNFLAILPLTNKKTYLVFRNSSKVKLDWQTGWSILIDDKKLELDFSPIFFLKNGEALPFVIISINSQIPGLLTKKELSIALWEWSKKHIHSEHVPILNL